MQLVDDAKQVWKHFSTWALGIVATLQILVTSAPDLVLAAWQVIPFEVRVLMGGEVKIAVGVLTALVAIWGIGGKLIKQKFKEAHPKPAPETGDEPQGLP